MSVQDFPYKADSKIKLLRSSRWQVQSIKLQARGPSEHWTLCDCLDLILGLVFGVKGCTWHSLKFCHSYSAVLCLLFSSGSPQAVGAFPLGAHRLGWECVSRRRAERIGPCCVLQSFKNGRTVVREPAALC
ncbi:uncharacterized protein LOC144616355 isoform X2 [Panthera onca]